MSSNMFDLLKKIGSNRGKIINNLIKGNVFTSNEIVESALECNLPYIIYDVSVYVEGISKKDIDRLTDYIIDYGNIKYIYDFAKNVKNAPTHRLADVMINKGSVEYIYEFAKNVEGAPIDRLSDAIIKSKETEYIYKFATEIKGTPVNLLIDTLIELKDSWYLCHFAKDTGDKMIKRKIYNTVLYEIKNAKDIYVCAKFMNDIDVSEIERALIATDSSEYIYKFACDIDGAHIDVLADTIIKLGESEYIYHFARSVKNAPLDKLATAIIKTGEITYIDLFMHIEGAPLEYMMEQKNRMIVGTMTDEEKLEYVLNLALNNDVKTINYCNDIYKELFLEEALCEKEEVPKRKCRKI